ncbi:hypothetical protein T484DRAFT_1841187 [Baffinella frigidus]|nr:hypothetical protein T484DRAFT_1841187 [Cryptophyta sp. CCMP2293]
MTEPDLSSWTLRGTPGLSCDSVCGSVGKTCVPGLLDQVDTSEEVAAVSQASMRAIFDLEGEGTGLHAHYRASSFDDVTKVWSDVSGNSRDGQALSLSAPPRELFAYCYGSGDCTTTINDLPTDEDLLFSLTVRWYTVPSGGHVEVTVGGTTSKHVLDASQTKPDYTSNCPKYSVMVHVKVPRAAYSTGSLLVQMSTHSMGSQYEYSCSGAGYAHINILRYKAGESSASAVTSSGHGAASSVAAVTGGARHALLLATLPATFTICSVSRYESATHSNNSVLGALAAGDAWYHGHSESTAGVSSYTPSGGAVVACGVEICVAGVCFARLCDANDGSSIDFTLLGNPDFVNAWSSGLLYFYIYPNDPKLYLAVTTSTDMAKTPICSKASTAPVLLATDWLVMCGQNAGAVSIPKPL